MAIWICLSRYWCYSPWTHQCVTIRKRCAMKRCDCSKQSGRSRLRMSYAGNTAATVRPKVLPRTRYERLLGDAMRGDASLFARQDSVEAAWRVVDPVLSGTTPVIEYEPYMWGPAEASRIVAGY